MAIGIYCLDVGQANCVVIVDEVRQGPRLVRQAALVDVGADGSRTVNWLRDCRIDQLRLIALTHNDRDHVAGLTQVVSAFRGRIDAVRFVADRPERSIPFWIDAQNWVQRNYVRSIESLDAPATSVPDAGRVLLAPPSASYLLFCKYPTIFDTAAIVRKAVRVGRRPGRGPNATSAVMGLAMPSRPKQTIVLFGGDLDFRGWRRLVEANRDLRADVFIVPHHGAPRYANEGFGHADLARAVKPTFALVSVGSRQRHAQRGRTAGLHPNPAMVRALRETGATVLCTQITRHCVVQPDTVPGKSVLPVLPDDPGIRLDDSGSACAGSVVITLPARGSPRVQRLLDHQTAVDGLLAQKQTPLCRP